MAVVSVFLLVSIAGCLVFCARLCSRCRLVWYFLVFVVCFLSLAVFVGIEKLHRT